MDPTIVVAIVAGAMAIGGIVAGKVWGGNKDELARLAKVEAKGYALEDYCHQLRDALDLAGLPVPPWPPELRRVDPTIGSGGT